MSESALGGAAGGEANSGGGGGGDTGGGAPASSPTGNAGAPASGGASAGGNSPANGGSEGGGSWHDRLPDDLRDNPSLKGYKTEADLAKAHVHAQRLIGADKIPLPGKDAGEEEWNGVYSRLGRPESPEGYDIKAAEGASKESLAAIKSLAHKAGLNTRQLQTIYDASVADSTAAKEASIKKYETMVEQKLGELKSEWPDNKYDENMKMAGSALNKIGGKDAIDWANRSGAGNDPTFIKLMHKVAGLMAEDKIKGDGGISFGEGKASIQAKIDSHFANPKGAYLDSRHPGHESAKAEVQNLYTMLNK